MNYQDYENIINTSDRKKKRNRLNKQLGQSSKAFNLFVLASIDFFYHGGAKQINIINDLLIMAYQCKGMNAARLGSYLKKVIPHDYREPVNHKSPPRFSKKNGDYLEFTDIQSFVSDNPLWYQYGRVDKSDFYVKKYLTSVATKLKKEGVNVNEFVHDLLEIAS